MTGKADFTPEEWKTILEAPVSAGQIVITSASGGMFREAFAVGKAYTEARKQHGESELLDEILGTKPKVDRTHSGSPQEMKEHGLQHLRDAVDALQRKATPDEVDGYRRFVLSLAETVAAAHREDGVSVSKDEQAAIDDISASLGSSS
ncbi:MAG: hypothetical protein ACJ764_01265 [Solirubrobacteraceae bacterium]